MSMQTIDTTNMVNVELMATQNELTVLKLKNEILDLKYKLERVQIEKVSRLEDSLFSPHLFKHYQTVAATLAKSQLIPKNYIGKPDDIFVAMAMGYQLGFPVEQSLQDISVINGRPCLWGDGLLALALSHPECEYIQEEPIVNQSNEVVGYTCKVKRKGQPEHVKSFTLQEAIAAKLLNKQGPWQDYRPRMYQMRARSLAIRDKFADALRGIRIAEIEEDNGDIIDGEIIQAPLASGLSQVDKLKQVLDIPNANANEDKISAPDTENDLDDMVSEEQLNKITQLLEIKQFNEERISKALAYYKIEALDQLSSKQANNFLAQLERS